MIHWNQIQILLTNQGVEMNNRQLTRDFLNFYPFKRRQQLMSIFLNFPEKITIFIELLKKKKNLAADSNNQKLLREIINIESEETQNIIRQETAR